MDFVNRIKKAASVLVSNSYNVADKAKSLAAQQNNPASNSGYQNSSVYNDGGQYTPSNPLPPQNQGKVPWAYQFMVGNNLVITPRTENGNMLPFDILKNVASSHDITALCIQMMIDQVVGDEWDITVADKNDRKHYEKDIQNVKDFFNKPDKVHLFNDWLKPILYDSLYGDCACMYKRRTRNGKLYSLEFVDGSTIKPLIDIYGRPPQPPYAAYQQIIYGYPYGSSSQKVAKTLGFTLDEISYRPRYRRAWTPYGHSPIEKILVKINIALRRDASSLNFFTDGNMPDGGLYTFDNENMTVDQIKQFAELYDEMTSGNLKERFKLKFLPKGKYTPTKEHKFDVQYDEWMARIVSIAFGVNPQAFIMLMNRSTGQLQDQQQTDIGLTPLENFLAEWFTDVIQNDLGYKHLKFKYVDEKKEDAKLSIQRDTEFVQSGIYTIDEVRSMRGMPPLTNMPNGVPPIIKVGNAIIPITKEYLEALSEAQIKALSVGNTQNGNNFNTEQIMQQNQEKISPQSGAGQTRSNIQNETIAQDTKTAQKAVQDELRQFEKFALRRLKKKTKSVRNFEPNVISEELAKEISMELGKTDSPDGIRKVFQKVEESETISELISDASDAVGSALEDIESYIEEQLDNISAEDLQGDNSEDKTALLLLLLLGGYDFKEKLGTVLENVLREYAGNTLSEAAKQIKAMGGNLSRADIKSLTDSLVDDRISFLTDEIERVTKEKIGAVLADVQSVEEIPGLLQSAYALSQDRAENIADIEQRTMENTARIAAAEKSGVVAAVLVSDGQEFDEPCITADGQIWSLSYAGDHVLEHPKCVRRFTYLTHDEVDAHGGIDEE